jgi:hypothetical protein
MNKCCRVGLCLLVSGVSLVAGGCLAVAAAGAAAAGTYAYVNGSLQGHEEAGVDRLHNAALGAMEQLGFHVKDDKVDATSAHIVAEEADGTDVKINIDSENDRLSKIGIRVGLLGDKPMSQMIYDKIKANL